MLDELANKTTGNGKDLKDVIADAKRGDIGNTSTMYASAFFENMNFEKYSEFVMKFPILFIQKNNKYISGKNYLFSDL